MTDNDPTALVDPQTRHEFLVRVSTAMEPIARELGLSPIQAWRTLMLGGASMLQRQQGAPLTAAQVMKLADHLAADAIEELEQPRH